MAGKAPMARRRRSLRRRLLLKRALTAIEVTALSVLPFAPAAQASLPSAVEKVGNDHAEDERADGADPSLLGGLPGVQLAQFSTFGRSGNRRGATNDDAHPPAVFRADEVDYDQDLSLVVSRGHVEIDQAGRILLADTVTYNQKTDTVTASGNVSLLETNGDILFADYIELTQQMRDAFVANARILMSDKSRIAGNTARRTDGKHTEIRKGVYSPCQLCLEDPTRAPTWQIMADTIIHDQDTKRIEYRDALVEFGGVPLIYTPYFSHPDPTVKRASGLLVPSFGNSTTLGAWASLPYYAVLDTDKDLTIAPIFSSKQGVNFAGEYRQRFNDGKFEGRFSITESDKVNEDGTTGSSTGTSKNVVRGHIFANGVWDIDDENRAGFDLRRATDQTYLRRYHFASGEDFLTSHGYFENFDRRNYGTVDTYAFQSQRVSVQDKGLPYVLPSASYNFVGEPNSFGARLSLTENLLNIARDVGNNTGRLSTQAAWMLPFTSPGGDVMSVTPRLLLQGYSIGRYPKLAKTPATSSALNPTLDPLLSSTTQIAATSTVNGTVGRAFPQIEASWRHPFIRRGEDESDIIEPIAAFFSAPRGGNNVRIPNEDSLGFEFNDSSLFAPNRYPGLDRVDGGTRVDYGLHAAIYTDSVYRTDLLVGQSYRLTGPEGFAKGSGLERNLSDLVGRVSVSPVSEFSVNYRFRLAQQNLASRRQEISTSFGPARIRLTLGYINLRSDIGSSQLDREQVSGNVRLALTPYWSLSGGTTESLKGGGNLLSLSGALTYKDDCLTFATAVTYSGTTDTDVDKGTSFTISLSLKNLGQIALPSLKA